MSDRAKELYAQLEDSYDTWTETANWTELLRLKSRMHNYSWRNLRLIQIQRPGTEMVAGYHDWQKHGRQVQRGSKAVWVLGPVTYKRKPEEITQDDPAEKRLAGFKPVKVFAVEDTEGVELPIVKQLTGDAPAQLWDELSAHLAKAGYTVVREDCSPKDGYTSASKMRVVTNATQPALHQLLTLIHESAHVELDHVKDPEEYQRHRGKYECEAESVAYVVAAAAGIEASTASFPYINSWVQGDRKVLEATADRVMKASRSILDNLPILAVELPTVSVDLPSDLGSVAS